jgi:hypothetical protein
MFQLFFHNTNEHKQELLYNMTGIFLFAFQIFHMISYMDL